MRQAVLAAALFAAVLSAQPNKKQPLQLQQVLESVDRHYPPLLSALQDKTIAQAEVTAAEGRFDLNLRAGYEGDFLGYYRNDVYRVGAEQPTTFQGMSFNTGYNLGRGSFAPYEGKLETDSAGEYRVGARLPLFRDRAIDPRRADLYKARLGQRVADLGVDQQKLLFIQLATRRYYDWVAAGQRLQAAKSVLQVATQREEQLKQAAGLGSIPQIDVTDNQRAILSRRALLVEAQRLVEFSAIELSLYLRDAQGSPRLPSEDELPPAFPATEEITMSRLQEDIDLALKRRPEIQRLAAQKDQVEVDRKLAQNQLMPTIDLGFQFSAMGGQRDVRRGPNDIIASLLFDLPVQRRGAKGRESAALARIQQYDQRERFTRDQVTAEVQDAYSALRAAYERAKVLRSEVEVSVQLEQAERERFKLGEGTLFLINLREQATFESVLRELSALSDYFRAKALYDFAIAEALRSGRP